MQLSEIVKDDNLEDFFSKNEPFFITIHNVLLKEKIIATISLVEHTNPNSFYAVEHYIYFSKTLRQNYYKNKLEAQSFIQELIESSKDHGYIIKEDTNQIRLEKLTDDLRNDLRKIFHQYKLDEEIFK